MDEPERPIAIPWDVRLRYVCTHWLQSALFLASVIALAWLWTHRAPRTVVVGQVAAIQVNVPASESGFLMPLDHPLASFDRVQKGITLVARFDVSDLLLEMQTLTAERDRIKAMIDSESERLRLQQQQLDLDRDQQQRDRVQHSLMRQRNRTSAEERIDDLQREISEIRDRHRKLTLKQTETASGKTLLELQSKHLMVQRTRIAELVQRAMAPTLQLAELDQQIQLKQHELAESESIGTTIAEQIAQLDREVAFTTQRMAKAIEIRDELAIIEVSPPKETAASVVDVVTLLAPLEHALRVQDAKIRELARQIAANEVRAPVSGMVSQVHCLAGTFVPRGEPIVTIAAEGAGHIVAYVDSSFGNGLRKNDTVQIRLRTSGSVVAEAKVMELGSQYELMPERLRRNPGIAQYGLPVKVSLPNELPLIPGEMVDLVFVDHSGLAFSL